MKRRAFIQSAVGALAASSELAHARLACTPFTPQGIQLCEAGINSGIATYMAQQQYASQWCWAACISMVFGYYGHSVPQQAIVASTWGTIVNLPGTPQQILGDLNRPWMDANGRPFFVSGDVSSANAMTAAQDLAQDMPLILGTRGHAVVLTALKYERDAYGRGVVVEAMVRDPWPTSGGRRVLTASEWFGVTFAVRIRVT